MKTRLRYQALACAFCLYCAMAASSGAAIVTYHFSGVHTDPGVGPPATDLIPDYELGDPFSGTLTYDTSALGGPMSYPGQPLAITILFDNTYSLNWTAPGSNDAANLWEDNDLVSFRKEGTPEAAADFNSVYASAVTVDLQFGPGQMPSDLASIDPNSPNVIWIALAVWLHGPNLVNPGMESSVFFADLISEITPVPEPSSLLLAAAGFAGLLAVARRRRARRRAA